MNKKYYLIFSVIFVLFTVSLISAGSYSGKLTVSKTSGGKIIISGSGQMPAYYCGNNILETYISEQCDGSNLGGESCENLGYDSGTLACQSNCVFDTTDCANDGTNGDTGGTTTSGGSRSSSSGGGSGCIENWECREWGECEDGKQTRICKEVNWCGTKKIVPDTIRDCSAEGLIGDEALKMLNQSQQTNGGFISRITGAVIGRGNGGILVPLLFIIVIVGLLVITLALKKRVISKSGSSDEDVSDEDVSDEDVSDEDVEKVVEGEDSGEEGEK